MRIEESEYIMTIERIIYEGEEYQLEWYHDKLGKSQALKYFEGMSNEQKRKAINLFKVMGDIGKIQNKTKFRNEADGIYLSNLSQIVSSASSLKEERSL